MKKYLKVLTTATLGVFVFTSSFVIVSNLNAVPQDECTIPKKDGTCQDTDACDEYWKVDMKHKAGGFCKKRPKQETCRCAAKKSAGTMPMDLDDILSVPDSVSDSY